MLGLNSCSALPKGQAAVPMGSSGSRRIRATTAAMVSGCMAGSSPWMLSTRSKPAPWAATAAATRSVPEASSGAVMATRPPKPSTTAAIRASSVATTTASTPAAARAASQAHWIIGRPAMRARGLPGNREDW